jgi:cell wall-associated NlpC family hydrolase
MSAALDPRTNAFRPDLADRRLEGRVASARFVEGVLRRVRAPSAYFHRSPSPDAPIVSEAIHGELVRVFEEQEAWAWVQLETDAYVGFMSADALGPIDPVPTHRVTALRAFVFPAPDLKLPPRAALPFGSAVALTEEVVTRGTPYRLLADGAGAIPSVQTVPLDAPRSPDHVAVAEMFIGVPYLWGGRTSFGFDCSGLVQTALAAAGIAAPRDTDMQERAIGRPVEGGTEAPLARGDLVFWKGHVGILSAPDRLLHANAHHMAVAFEPLAAALARIGPPTGIRRP